jgi:hypothetical protein
MVEFYYCIRSVDFLRLYMLYLQQWHAEDYPYTWDDLSMQSLTDLKDAWIMILHDHLNLNVLLISFRIDPHSENSDTAIKGNFIYLVSVVP